jgi:hypothetical protein
MPTCFSGPHEPGAAEQIELVPLAAIDVERVHGEDSLLSFDRNDSILRSQFAERSRKAGR